MNKILSHDELQHIEHANKALKEHLELVNLVVNESEALFNNYLPILQTYINGIAQVSKLFGEEVKQIYNSSRELRVATGGVQDVMNFISAVQKLDALLTPELIGKLRNVVK